MDMFQTDKFQTGHILDTLYKLDTFQTEAMQLPGIGKSDNFIRINFNALLNLTNL